MQEPVLVDVTRGGLSESRHHGAVAVVDGAGALLWSAGDIQRPVFPRSAVKAIQALPVVESGADIRFAMTARDLAFLCASHSGEPCHVEAARSLLSRAGLKESALECGAHWPLFGLADIVAKARKGSEPQPVANNCSGKHAGFLCLARMLDEDSRDYIQPNHKVQEQVRAALEDVIGVPHNAGNRGIDGCGIPTYAVPLQAMAHGFAKMASGNGLAPKRAAAARTLMEACMEEPVMVAGKDRFDTKIMQAGAGRIFVKTGAEGVYCACLPDQGVGIALKCDDGATRASETAIAAVLKALVRKDGELSETLAPFAVKALTNWEGVSVGEIRPASILSEVPAL